LIFSSLVGWILSPGWCRLEHVFDMASGFEAVSVLADPNTAGIDRVYAANRLKMIAEAAEAKAIADLALADGWSEDVSPLNYDVVGRRLVRIGADGTGLVDETLPLEIAAARCSSVGLASSLIVDVINLVSRHPLSWEAVQDHRVPLWQAQRVARVCASSSVSKDQAVQIDGLVNPSLGKIGFTRLTNLVLAMVMRVAPERVRDVCVDSHGVTRWTSDQNPAMSYVQACVDTADAVFFDATVDRVADILGEQGDTRSKQYRRGLAVGVLATPAVALSLLGVHTRRGLDPDDLPPVITDQVAKTVLPKTQVYVHVSDESLATGSGVARVENIGPVLVDPVGSVLGQSSIRLTPVIRVGGPESVVDAYEIPDRIREQVLARDRHEVYPFSSREARGQDLDHTESYQPGLPGQTRPANLGPLSRKAHRGKTHGGFTLVQSSPGVFWWKTRLGQIFRVGPDGTTNYTYYDDTS
jgi:hypothetical protein